jgi:hypothetical protein
MTINEAGKRLSSIGIDISRVTREVYQTAKSEINPVLEKAGIIAGWTSGGAGSFDYAHPYPGTLRTDSGDIDIMIDPTDLLKKFPADIEEWNQTIAKPLGPKALANAFADPSKKSKLQMSASKAALAAYMTKNGLPTDPGTLTVHYISNGKNYSIDLIVRPRNAWPLHTHDFSLDPGMRGGDLWNEIYPALAKVSSQKKIVDPKTGEEKGNIQFSPDHGLIDRETGKVVASGAEKDKIAKFLIGPEATARDISSLSGIKKALTRYPDKWNAIKQFYPQPELAEGTREWFRFIMDNI